MKKLLIIALLLISAHVMNAQDSSIIKSRFRVTQSAAFAILYGNDDDKQNEADYNTPADGVDLGDVADNIDDKIGSNLGANVEYSLTFIPGKISDGVFKDNPLGFAFSLGTVLSVDNSGEYFTFDGLLKIGIETGYDHSMGVGLDFLFGTGKSPGFAYFLDEGNTGSEPIPYTEWCLKNGFQFWVRTGLIRQILPNSTTSLFVRYVYSMEPDEIESEDTFLFWQEEALQIGLLVSFKF